MKTKRLLFLFSFISFVSLSKAQEPAYRRFPTIPPIKLLLTDSSTVFTNKDLKKNKPVFLIIFSPDCDHCKKETEELIKEIDNFKNIQIIMASFMPVDKIKPFYKEYNLQRFKNITVGYDMQHMLPTYYRISYTPFLAFYDKDGKLIDGFQGNLPVSKVLEKFNK